MYNTYIKMHEQHTKNCNEYTKFIRNDESCAEIRNDGRRDEVIRFIIDCNIDISCIAKRQLEVAQVRACVCVCAVACVSIACTFWIKSIEIPSNFCVILLFAELRATKCMRQMSGREDNSGLARMFETEFNALLGCRTGPEWKQR